MKFISRRSTVVLILGRASAAAGKSYPTADMSSSNLQLLNSAQALADLARFTHFFKDKVRAAGTMHMPC